MNDIKQKVFLSCVRERDGFYADKLKEELKESYDVRTVDGDGYPLDDSGLYMDRLIEDGNIGEGTLIIVLVGPETYRSRHVDWEISAGLGERLEDNAALIGIILPDFPHFPGQDFIPERLVDNIRSGYAGIYDLDTFLEDSDNLIKTALDRREDDRILMNNSRRELKKDL